MRIEPVPLHPPASGAESATVAAGFESLLLAQLLDDAGVGGDGPDGALARRALADALAANQPLGIARLLKGLTG